MGHQCACQTDQPVADAQPKDQSGVHIDGGSAHHILIVAGSADTQAHMGLKKDNQQQGHYQADHPRQQRTGNLALIAGQVQRLIEQQKEIAKTDEEFETEYNNMVSTLEDYSIADIEKSPPSWTGSSPRRLKSRRSAALPKSTKERLSCEQKSEVAAGVVVLHRRQRTPEV